MWEFLKRLGPYLKDYKGRIAMSGGPELALELEEKGYDWVKEGIG